MRSKQPQRAGGNAGFIRQLDKPCVLLPDKSGVPPGGLVRVKRFGAPRLVLGGHSRRALRNPRNQTFPVVFYLRNWYIQAMMCGGKMAVFCVLSGSLLVVATKPVTADAAQNPYDGITDRNVFDLKPPPAPVRPEDLKAPPPDLKLTGITSILGMKQALLKAQIPARPPQQAKEEFYILTENQSEGDVEVIAINEKAGTVKVNNHGTLQTLDFVSNGVKLPNASSLPMPAGPGPAPMPVMGLQSSLQGGAPGRGMGMRQIPTRPVRTSTTSDGDQGAGAYGQNSTGGGAQGLGAASSGMGTGAVIGNQSTPGFTRTPDYGISGEQQKALIEINRAQLLEQGNAEEASMLPPTDYTPPPGQSLLPQ